MKRRKFLLIMSRYGFFLILIFVLAAMTVLIAHNHSVQNKKIAALEEVIYERLLDFDSVITGQFDKQTEMLLEAGQIIASIVIDEIGAGAASTRNRINITDERIQRINAVYSNLLEEMEKRTLDSLYMESVLVDMEQEARVLFGEGRFAQASGLYFTVANAQPENFEARFFHLYSLFLNNRMDRNNYPQVREGFLALERNGFIRSEIREVLEFIEFEERGLEAEVLF